MASRVINKHDRYFFSPLFLKAEPYKTNIRQSLVTRVKFGFGNCLLPKYLLCTGTYSSGKNKSERKFLIRQFSEKNQTLQFVKSIVNLNTVYLINEQIFFINALQSTTYANAKWLQRKKDSILSFDSRYNQFLFSSNHFYRLHLNRKLGHLYETNLDKMSFLSSDLANLGLSLKVYTLLKRKGIHKIGSLVAYSPRSLLQLLNQNRYMFAELKRCLLVIALCGNA